MIKGRHEADMRAQRAEDALRVAESRTLQSAGELAMSATDLTDVRGQLEHAEERIAALSAELARVQASRAWRGISRYRRLRAWLGL